MANVEESYTIELNKEEAIAFKRLLGSMTDDQFSVHGIIGDNRRMMSDIWECLPFEDESPELFDGTKSALNALSIKG